MTVKKNSMGELKLVLSGRVLLVSKCKEIATDQHENERVKEIEFDQLSAVYYMRTA